MRQRMRIALAVALAVGGAGSLRAQAPAAPKVSVTGAPDVQVMVAPGKAGTQVALVFPGAVETPKIREHIDSVARALGVPARNVVIDNRRLTREDPSKVGEAPVMSSGAFLTEARLIDPAAGTLAVEPLLIGLQALDAVNVTFLTPPGFAYRGVTASADNRVGLEFAGGEGAYTFVANIHSRPLDGLRLALEKAPERARPQAPPSRNPLPFVLVGLLAVGGAAGTFVALRRTGGR